MKAKVIRMRFNKSNITDPKHNKTRKILKIIGPIVLGIGIIFFLIGIIDFFSAFNGMGTPTLFWACFVGIVFIGIGSTLTGFGFMKNVGGYVASQSAPILSDTVNYVADNISDSIADTANKVKKCSSKTCPKCGAINDENDKFCSNCGTPLTKKCPKCQNENNIDSKFCSNCGEKLD